MIVETTSADYASLLRGAAPRNFKLADTAIAPTAVLEMLADVAVRIRASFPTASWLIVEHNELVGMCSITRPPESGAVDIGYGVAPSRQRRGIATRAINEVVLWACNNAEVSELTAETSAENIASQQVLVRNGFVRTGERIDDEDGPLFGWRCSTVSKPWKIS